MKISEPHGDGERKDKYDLLCQQLDMTITPSGGKLGGTYEGDSGFSSRTSVVSARVEGDGQPGCQEPSSEIVIDKDVPDAVTPVKKPVTCDEQSRCGVRPVAVGVGKFLAIVGLLYLFICSLDLLGNAFQLLGGKAAGRVFAQSDLLLNPITGLMMGILATVLLQSSSTSTSIIITMVSSGIIDVQPAIPIIMGCNIGTTVTNTLVSLAHSNKGKEFERAFSGATVHDVFNWLTVMILLPLEASAHVLYKLTSIILSQADFSSFKGKKQDLLKTLTKPLTKMVVQVDKKVISQIAENDPLADDKRLLKTFCKYETAEGNSSAHQLLNDTVETCDETFHSALNYFHASLTDSAAGAILLVGSIFLLTGCLVCLVKVLNSILKDRITCYLKRTINSKLPRPFAWLTGYLAILIGAGLTIVVQSSSVFTSALTPLVGVGCLKLRRMYPLTLGSNIGTTATGILAALAAPANKLDIALQLALCHLFFNICGIALFYPIHPMRKIPINAAKLLGKTTAKYRWFAVFYLIVLFFFMPGFIFALSLTGMIPFIATLSVIGAVVVSVVILNVLQNKCKDRLPKVLQTWEFLPEFLRSLEPLDRVIRKLTSIFTRCACKSDERVNDVESQSVVDEDDEFDRENTAIEEDECTELFGKLCCGKKSKQVPKTKDEGFSEPEQQALIRGHGQSLENKHFHLASPIFTPPGKNHPVRLSLNATLHTSPSETPLLQHSVV